MSIWSRIKTYADTTSGTSTTIAFDEPSAVDSTYLLVALVYTETEQIATPSGWSSQGSISATNLRLRIMTKQGDGTTNSITVTTTGANAIHQAVLLAFPGYVSTINHKASLTTNGTGTSAAAPAYTSATTITNVINIAYGIKAASGAWGSWDSSHDTISIGDRMSVGVVAYTTTGQNPTPGIAWTGSATYRVGDVAFQGVSAGSTAALTNSAAPAVTPASGVGVGTLLSVTNGTWSATPDSYAYQWNRAGSPIAGATNATYTLLAADAGSTVTVTVTAIKSGYTPTGATSSATGTIAATVPSAPSGLVATASNVQVALTWSAPASNGGAAITDYSIQYSSDSGSSWSSWAHTASTVASATVTGLTNGTAYVFKVAGINSAGTGTYSTTASATPVAGNGTILPSDSNIVYSPYNWNITGSVAQTINAGSYIRTTFQGGPTSIVATFDTSGTDGSAPIAIRVDNEPVTVVSRAASISITIPNNGWSKHTVELTVVQITGNDLWNAPTSTLKFTGFTVAPVTVTTTTTRRRPYNILCFGDSITNGYATTSAYIIDSRMSWAYPLRDYLSAEVGVVGFNAQGFSHNGSANIPYFGSTYDHTWSSVTRSFTTPSEPNLVLINMGTNDGAANNTTSMTTVLNGILAATTNTKIVVIQQWNGTNQRAYWQSAIAASTTPSRITYLDTTGWWSSSDAGDGLHPWGYINITDLSPRIATSVLPLLTGATISTGNGSTVTPKRFINKNGVAIPLV